MVPKTVCIIGSGPAGLVSAKEALSVGLLPAIFEKEDELGGVWNPRSGSVWPSMSTNISKYSVCFGDSPQPPEQPMFLPSSEMHEYLLNYAHSWGLKKYIQFQSKVVSIAATPTEGEELRGSGGWTVSWSSLEGDSQTMLSRRFDAVIVATGIFSIRNVPDIKGLQDFHNYGTVMHSKDYKSSEPFVGKRVLTLGGSLSGVEIASDVVSSCSKSIHCFRRPFWIFRKSYVIPTGNCPEGKSIPIDWILFSRKLHNEKRTLEEGALNTLINNLMLDLCTQQQQHEGLQVPKEDFGKYIHTNVSDTYLDNVLQQKISVVKQPIKEIQRNRVIFEDGIEEEVDGIILATGFGVDLGFLQQEVLDTLSYRPEDTTLPMLLFEGTLHPDLPNLFFVGVAKQPWFATMEQQGRWAARVLSGQVELPPREEMLRGVDRARKIRESQSRCQFPYGDITFWTDRIAEYNGSLPDLNNPTLEDFGKGFAQSNGSIIRPSKEEILDGLIHKPFLAAHYNLKDNPKEVLKLMEEVANLVA